MNSTETRKDYKPAELEIIMVEQTDIICTSSSIMSLEVDEDL